MVKKFNIFIGFFILIQNIQINCFGQTNNGKVILNAQLSVDTCSFEDDAFKVTVLITNAGIFPVTIYTNGCFSENIVNGTVAKGELFLIVEHDDTEYRYYESVILNKHELPKKHCLWYNSFQCNGVFYMSHFLKERYHKPNKDFGNYLIKAAFINQSNDTIYSNSMLIHYNEQKQ